MLEFLWRKNMNNKYLRYFLGFLLLALILIAFYFSGRILFLVSAFFIIITMMEYRKMMKNKDIYPHKFLPEIVGILCAYVFSFTKGIEEHSIITPILIGGVVFSFILTVLRNKKPYIMTSLSTIAAILLIFCGLYIIKLTYYFNENSAWYVICVYFAAVLMGDYAASILGPKFNQYKLASEISPDKTIAGSFFNLIFTCLPCFLLVKFIDLSIIKCLFLGIIISIFSQLGDLTISSFKRDLDIKHSGNLFMGYGGILDRMDAFLFSAPAVYYYLFLVSIV